MTTVPEYLFVVFCIFSITMFLTELAGVIYDRIVAWMNRSSDKPEELGGQDKIKHEHDVRYDADEP